MFISRYHIPNLETLNEVECYLISFQTWGEHGWWCQSGVVNRIWSLHNRLIIRIRTVRLLCANWRRFNLLLFCYFFTHLSNRSKIGWWSVIHLEKWRGVPYSSLHTQKIEPAPPYTGALNWWSIHDFKVPSPRKGDMNDEVILQHTRTHNLSSRTCTTPSPTTLAPPIELVLYLYYICDLYSYVRWLSQRAVFKILENVIFNTLLE